jgi:signal peptidase I
MGNAAKWLADRGRRRIGNGAATGRRFFLPLPPRWEALCVVPLSLTLIGAGNRFVGQAFRVEGRCMEPRLYTGERILGDKWTLRHRPPRRGEVVIFACPADPSQLYIKRVVALGGEMVTLRRGVVYVNGRPLPEPYLVQPGRGDFGPHRVIDGRYFVLGDNRDASEDSRHWGDVDGNAVVARAWLRYAPPSRWRSAPF